jgi:hypothetical protein
MSPVDASSAVLAVSLVEPTLLIETNPFELRVVALPDDTVVSVAADAVRLPALAEATTSPNVAEMFM